MSTEPASPELCPSLADGPTPSPKVAVATPAPATDEPTGEPTTPAPVTGAPTPSLCSCSPLKYQFAINFSTDCSTNGLDGEDGIDASVCYATLFATNQRGGDGDVPRREIGDSLAGEVDFGDGDADGAWGPFVSLDALLAGAAGGGDVSPGGGEGRAFRDGGDGDVGGWDAFVSLDALLSEADGGDKRASQRASLEGAAVEVYDVQFLEFDTTPDMLVISQEDADGLALADGDAISFASASAGLVPGESASDQLARVPGGVQITVRGRLLDGETGEELARVRNTVTWRYTNGCEGVPFEDGGVGVGLVTIVSILPTFSSCVVVVFSMHRTASSPIPFSTHHPLPTTPERRGAGVARLLPRVYLVTHPRDRGDAGGRVDRLPRPGPRLHGVAQAV